MTFIEVDSAGNVTIPQKILNVFPNISVDADAGLGTARVSFGEQSVSASLRVSVSVEGPAGTSYNFDHVIPGTGVPESVDYDISTSCLTLTNPQAADLSFINAMPILGDVVCLKIVKTTPSVFEWFGDYINGIVDGSGDRLLTSLERFEYWHSTEYYEAERPVIFTVMSDAVPFTELQEESSILCISMWSGDAIAETYREPFSGFYIDNFIFEEWYEDGYPFPTLANAHAREWAYIDMDAIELDDDNRWVFTESPSFLLNRDTLEAIGGYYYYYFMDAITAGDTIAIGVHTIEGIGMYFGQQRSYNASVTTMSGFFGSSPDVDLLDYFPSLESLSGYWEFKNNVPVGYDAETDTLTIAYYAYTFYPAKEPPATSQTYAKIEWSFTWQSVYNLNAASWETIDNYSAHAPLQEVFFYSTIGGDGELTAYFRTDKQACPTDQPLGGDYDYRYVLGARYYAYATSIIAKYDIGTFMAWDGQISKPDASVVYSVFRYVGDEDLNALGWTLSAFPKMERIDCMDDWAQFYYRILSGDLDWAPQMINNLWVWPDEYRSLVDRQCAKYTDHRGVVYEHIVSHTDLQCVVDQGQSAVNISDMEALHSVGYRFSQLEEDMPTEIIDVVAMWIETKASMAENCSGFYAWWDTVEDYAHGAEPITSASPPADDTGIDKIVHVSERWADVTFYKNTSPPIYPHFPDVVDYVAIDNGDGTTTVTWHRSVISGETSEKAEGCVYTPYGVLYV